MAVYDGNARAFVIDKCVQIEHLVSDTIGSILDIDWKESKSFGQSGSSLSFNHKVNIIKDLKGLDKEEIKKFTCLMEIRNKFAHVLSVSTFKVFISDFKVGRTACLNLINWYALENSQKKLTSKEINVKKNRC